MSVTSISQIAAGRTGGLGKKFQRDYAVVWRAIVNDPRDGPATLITALQAYLGHTLLYTSYVGYENTSDLPALCISIKPEPFGGEGEWKVWRITANFSTNWQEQQQQEEDPEDDPPLFWIETEFVDGFTFKEYNGNLIKNAAKQKIAAIPKRDEKQTYVWERNYNTINTGVWKDYNNSVNTDQILDIEPKQGRLSITVSKPEFRNEFTFYRVQFRAEVNDETDDGWEVRPPDVGPMVIGADGKLQRPTDGDGNPIDGEVPLKADGTQERDSTVELRYLAAKKIYKPRAWGNLGLPFN